MKKTFILFVLLASASIMRAQSLDYIKSQIAQGEYLNAAKMLRPLAESGNAEAQCMAAELFFKGKGVNKDANQGVKYATLSANQGNGQAVLLLYYYYHDTKDELVRAFNILSHYRSRINTQSSLEEIEFLFAKSLIRGDGVTKDEKKGWEIMGQGKADSPRKGYYDGHIKDNHNPFPSTTFEKHGYEFTITNNNEVKIGIPYTSRSLFEGRLSIPASVRYNGNTYAIAEIDASGMQMLYDVTSITIPKTIKEIGGMAFWHCDKLENVYIPASTTYIGVDVFEYCGSLISFNVDSGNPNYCAVDGVLFTKDKTVLKCYPAAKLNSDYTLPSTVTKIEGSAFLGSELSSIKMTNPNLTVSPMAFWYCTSLNTVHMHVNVFNNLYKQTFYGCSNLKSITVHLTDGTTTYKSAEPYKQR